MFETDGNLETEGLWLDYGDARIKIARAGGSNKRYEKRLEVLSRPHKRLMKADRMPLREMNKLLKQVYAESVVLGWEGVTDREGNVMPFSAENCIRLFDDLPDLWEDVLEQARNSAIFRREVLESDSKNS